MKAHHKIHRKMAIVFILLLSLPLTAQVEQAEQLIRQMEEREVFDSSYLRGILRINDRFGLKESSFDSWALGSEYSLIEFTSVEEAGQKILRSEDSIYLFYPEADEVIRLSGAALRDGILGSDVSYEDMTGDRSLLDDYEVISMNTELLEGTETYVIELQAKGSNVPYAKQILWIDSMSLNGILVHKFSLSDRLLKVERILEFREQDGYVFPVHVRIEDRLKSNSYTEFIIEEIEVNYPLDIGFFSLEELTW